MKSVIKILSFLFPSAIANFAYKQLTSPQIKKLRQNELETLDKAQKEIFKFYDFDIQTYRWGNGDKRVLLIHGWEGQAGNFSDLVERLLKENYTIYAFDGPSHGFSSKGQTSLFEFSELVGVLIKKYGVSKLVSHSFGGVATTFGLSDYPEIEIEKYVLLTVPDRFLERIEDVSQRVGITEKVKQKLITRIQNESNVRVEELNVSDYVQKINVQQALIIHDKNDRIIPIEQSKRVQKNWKNARHQSIEGTGHFRILRTESVLEDVVAFLN
jgi:pimeloyl-ACP methyl ester carboxylesterase